MMKWMLALVVGAMLVPAVASADPPKSADDWFKEGETQYDLGNFDQAAEDFKQAFSTETNETKRPAYLYNVAQAYRQGGKCKDAAFFYKRFLALKDRDTVKPLKPATRAEIEKLVQETEDCAKKQEASSGTPPVGTMQPGGNTTGTTGTETTGTSGNETATGTTGTTGTTGATGTTAKNGKNGTKVASNDGEDGEDGEDNGEVTKSMTGAPKLISARLIGGAAKLTAGGLDVPLEATFTLIAGYPITLNDKMRVEAGIAATETPVGYTNSITGEKATASFASLLANGSLTYAVAPKIGVRGDLGAGVLVLSGIDQMGSPFTAGNAGTTGALTMLAVRVGVSADYEITPNIVATVVPFAFSYSPARSDLRSDISAITRIDFMVGVGYRM